MMHNLSAIELALIVGEMQRFVGFYVQKFYDLGGGKFRIKIRGDSVNTNIFCMPPKALNETKYAEECEPTQFAIAVRKRIINTKIESISMLGNDRIVVFKLAGSKQKSIILEMFGMGNLIVVDDLMNIELAYRREGASGRKIIPKERYLAPQHQQENSTLPPFYMDEAFARCGFSKADKLSAVQEAKLGEASKEIAKSIEESRSAIVYMDGGMPAEFSLIPLSKYAGKEEKKFASIEEALDFAYMHSRIPARKESGEQSRLAASIKKQLVLIEEWKKELAYAMEAGNFIFSNKNILNLVIEALNNDRHMAIEKLRSMFPDIEFISLDLKNKKVIIRMI
ncbi:MAG: NFACT family protein [Candidatus Micrarchaeaceae archaeon]